jgi:hypothetical protein
MAISFCRAVARARRRLAMFAHAISKTNRTAPIITDTTTLTSPGTRC